MSSAIDFGKAMGTAVISDDLRARNVSDAVLNHSQDFVASSASDLQAVYNSGEYHPYNIESIEIRHSNYPNDMGGFFAAIFPKKKFDMMTNIMSGFPTTVSTLPEKRIEWKVAPNPFGGEVGGPPSFQKLVAASIVEGISTDNLWKQGPNYPPGYLGARWATKIVDKQQYDVGDSISTEASLFTSKGMGIFEFSDLVVMQESLASANLLWGIESKITLPVNVPFYLDIRRLRRTVKDVPSFICCRINKGTNDEFDILVIENQNPRIYDMGPLASTTDDLVKQRYRQLMLAIPPDVSSNDHIRIGILPVLGRLAIYINEHEYIYSRPNLGEGGSENEFAIQPIKLQVKDLQIWGNNCMAMVGFHSMVFPPGRTALPIEGNFNVEGTHTSEPWASITNPIPYKEDQKTLGYCAAEIGGGPSATPDDDMFDITCPEAHGRINLVLLPHYNYAAGAGSAGASATANKYYGCELSGQHLNWVPNMATLSTEFEMTTKFDETKTYFGAPPFLFRLRGVEELNPLSTNSSSHGLSFARSGLSPRSFYLSSRTSNPSGMRTKRDDDVDISGDLIAITRSFSAPEFCSIDHTAEITLYNEGGTHNDLMEKGKGIQICTGWGTPNLVFTGVTLGGTRSEVAGKEILMVHCEDYMRVLEDTKIINSPYYDGLDAFDALMDLTLRAGITPEDDTDNPRYYLPAGYSFTTPKMRMPKYTSIKEGCSIIAKLAERVFYFDGEGLLHWSYLQGGLDFTVSYVIAGEFYSNPDSSSDGFNIILDEKRTDHKVGQAVNQILVKTIDRSAGAVYMLGQKATEVENVLPFKKVMYLEQAALASQSAAQLWMLRLKTRVFKTPIGISFTTVTNKAIWPLDFIKVNGKDFRVRSLTETLNAEDNSLVTNITAEWLGD